MAIHMNTYRCKKGFKVTKLVNLKSKEVIGFLIELLRQSNGHKCTHTITQDNLLELKSDICRWLFFLGTQHLYQGLIPPIKFEFKFWIYLLF